MRREGFELSISRPRVLFQQRPVTGQRLEPIEEVVIDVDEEYAGSVVEKLTKRRGDLVEMRPAGAASSALVFHAPSRALIGYHGEFLTDTRGTGVMNRSVPRLCSPIKGRSRQRHTGCDLSRAGRGRGLCALEPRGSRAVMFVEHGTKVYSGMIIGEHNRGNDLEVNPLKGKKLTNMRAAGKDDAVLLTPPVQMTLERRSPISPTTSWSRSRRSISACASATSTRTSARRRARRVRTIAIGRAPRRRFAGGRVRSRRRGPAWSARTNPGRRTSVRRR
jgi:GTP-binding protein